MSWPIVQLGEVVSIARDAIQPSSIVSGVTYVGLENITGDGTFVGVRQVDSGELASAKFTFTPEHILYGKLRPYLRKTAKPPFTGICSTDILPLLPGSRIDRDYLYHYLRRPEVVELATARSSGVNLPRISPNVLREFELPLPPLPEQKRIAAILDKADALRRKRREAIGKLDTLLQSVFLEMFGDPVSNTLKWKIRSVESFCRLVRGSSPRPKGDARYYGGPVPRLMVADVTRDGWIVTPMIDSLTEAGAKLSRPIKAGTVVMAVSGEVGVPSMLSIDACIHDGFVGFADLDDTVVKPLYLMVALSMLRITHEGRKAGAIFQNLTTYDVKNMEIPIPPIDEQEKFANAFRSIGRMRKRVDTGMQISRGLQVSLEKRFFD